MSNTKYEGIGAAYIRISDDHQDTQRQYDSLHEFEKREGVSIPEHLWFKDEGWARDKAERRPDFQRLLRTVEAGGVQWIAVDKLDRYGTKDSHQLMHFLYRLRENKCRLYDVAGKEWTSDEIGMIISAVVEGEKSKGEQREKSYRVLGGKIAKAKTGEWQGGPVHLGFDVASYERGTDKELWRIVFVGRGKRLKVFPDDRTEQFDDVPALDDSGKPKLKENGKPKMTPNPVRRGSLMEVLRITPSRDNAKVAAAVSVFKRFASESVSFTALAHYLNELGFRNSYGGYFQAQHVEAMLEDPIYLGVYTYNKRHSGKFHRFAGNQTVPVSNYEEAQSKNDRDDWVSSQRLFKPLVDQKTWDTVQKKLSQPRRVNAPRSPALYLAGLVHCGNCGQRMVAGPSRKPKTKPRKDGFKGERVEYFCGTYHKAKREGRTDCTCHRNGIFQDELQPYVDKWLEKAGQRLEILTKGIDSVQITEPLRRQEQDHWRAFIKGVSKVTDYLSTYHREEYHAVMDQWHTDDNGYDPLEGFISAYERCFDPKKLQADKDTLEAEHDALYAKRKNLTTPRTMAKADAELLALEAQLEELENYGKGFAESVAAHYRQANKLCGDIVEAQRALTRDGGEQVLRRKAENMRAVIKKIECSFTPTGERGGGWGKKNSLLTSVTIHPVSDGESVVFPTGSKGTLPYSKAHSCMYRTCVGSMR